MKILSEIKRSILVGVTGTLLNLSILYLAKEMFHLHYLTGALLANIITMISIFLADRYYTFRHGNGSFHVQFVKYVIIYVGSNLGSIALLAFLVEVFGLSYLLAQTIATTLISFVTFLIFKYWIFHCHEWF